MRVNTTRKDNLIYILIIMKSITHTKRLIHFSKYFVILILSACSSESEPIVNATVEKKAIELPKTRFTFSQYLDVDFVISAGSYQILYA